MSLIDFLYPKHCPVCLDVLPPGRKLICDPCKNKIRYVRSPVCFKCGKPISDGTREYCVNCEKHKPPFVKGIVYAEYSSKYIRRMLSEVKYHGNRQLLDYPCMDFAGRIEKEVKTWGAEALIPVPVHESRLRDRGYNQAEEIAKRIGKALQIPVDAGCLLRTGKTEAQKKLDRTARLLNLQKAFSASTKNLPYKTVILVDDIYTTGSTTSVCTNVLLQAGVEKVYLLTMASGRDESME